MNTTTKYSEKIQEVARYAKSINFDVHNGDIKELMRLYLNNTLPLYSSENREDVLNVLKSQF
jgi:hypothetical protein